jgi:DNA polymerase-3 subunit gamma/tau
LAEEISFQEQDSYRVTARKWRPKVFSDVTSQEFITKTLKNSIKNNRISHAYLFSGPRGVGKTTVARILAKSLNCLNPTPDGDPCNQCVSCEEINNDNRNHPDVFEIDGASNRNIEDVRELKEKVKYGPIRSKYKIFIIDEVHMLTGPSFNALLKTLEEPPKYVVFIFATTAPEKVPLTILGRCQKFDFKRLTIDEIQACIKLIAEAEKINIDEESLFFISKKGDGSMRDSQGLFDIASAYCDNNITYDKLKIFFNLAESDVFFNITDFIKNKDGSGLLSYFDSLMNKGYDMQTFLDSLTEHFRNLLVAVSTYSTDLIEESESVKKHYRDAIGRFTQIEIINSLKLILQTENTFKYSSNQRTLIESLLVELIIFTDTKEISAIIDELKELNIDTKKKFSSDHVVSDNPLRHYEVHNPVHSEKEVKISYAASKELESNTPPQTEIRDIVQDSPPVSVLSPSVTLSTDLSTGIDDIQTHWSDIKDQVKSERKWVYSMLKDTSFKNDGNMIYTIRINDKIYDMLYSYKDYLTGKITSHFGKELTVKFIKDSASDQPAENLSQLGAASIENNETDNFERIRKILLNDFNAKEVE